MQTLHSSRRARSPSTWCCAVRLQTVRTRCERRADIVGSIVRGPGRSYRASSRSQRTASGAARGRCSPRPASRSHRTELRPIGPVGHSRRIARRVQRRARWPPSRAARRSWPSALCASGWARVRSRGRRPTRCLAPARATADLPSRRTSAVPSVTWRERERRSARRLEAPCRVCA